MATKLRCSDSRSENQFYGAFIRQFCVLSFYVMLAGLSQFVLADEGATPARSVNQKSPAERISPSDKKPFAQVKQPTNAIELLQNAMVALKTDDLMREDFYTEEVLRRYFGENRKFTWFISSAEKSVKILNFDDITEPIKTATYTYPAIDFGVGLLRGSDKNKAHSDLEMKFFGHTTKITADMIKRTFGSDYREDDTPYIIVETSVSVKTFNYDFSNAKFNKKASFVVYDRDGYLDNVTLTEEAK